MIGKIALIYVVVEAGCLIALIAASIFFGRRYLQNKSGAVPAGFKKTEEVNIDPTSGDKLRVYYNEATGERKYIIEK